MNRNRIVTNIVLAAVALCACEKPPALPVRPSEVSVTTTIVTAQTVAKTYNYPGLTASPRSIPLDARVEGFLLKQEVADGAMTTAGQVIYRIDPRQYEASLAQAEATLAQAIAERDYAKKEMERNAPLVPANAISQQSFDQLVANYQSDEAQVLAQQAAVLNAALNLSYCTIASPFPALLGASESYEGAVVGPSVARTLNTVVQLDPMWAQFSPSATEWPLYAALLAKGPVTAQITYGGDPDIQAAGRVVFSNNVVSTSTSTLMMRVEFENPKAIFRPGTYVNVELALGEQPNVIVVPQQALFAREADIYVWKVLPDQTVVSVKVEPMRKVGNLLALKSGPAVGDRIVVDGTQKLHAGSKVVEATATPAATTTATPGAAAPGSTPTAQPSK